MRANRRMQSPPRTACRDDVRTRYIQPITSSLYRCVTIQMEDEVRTPLLLLLMLQQLAVAVSQLVSRRRVPGNGATAM